MALIVAMVSQKGGVGKSTLARYFACEFAAQDWNVKIGDLDISQATSFQWRTDASKTTLNPMSPLSNSEALPRPLRLPINTTCSFWTESRTAPVRRRHIAEQSQLIVIPTGLSLDDLTPAVVLAHDLVKTVFLGKKSVFALCRVGDSAFEIEEGADLSSKRWL